jgi:hypothetical protein
VSAVEPDEVALLAGLVGDGLVEVIQTLVEVEEGVGRALAQKNGDVQLNAALDERRGAVLVELRVEVGNDARRGLPVHGSVRPLSRGDAVSVRDVDVLREHRCAGGVERCRPDRPGDVVRREALRKVVPGDLRREGVEAGASFFCDLVEGGDRLVTASVAPADGGEDGIVRDRGATLIGVVANPVETRDVVDHRLDVLGLEIGVLDVGLSPAGSVTALVDADDAESGIEERLRLRDRAPSAPTPTVR